MNMSFENPARESAPKFEYSTNPELNQSISEAINHINSGGDPAELGLEKRIKNAPTFIMRASADQPQKRYQPGSKLLTYTGVDAAGNLIKETYNDGVADITEDSAILKNEAPIVYPEGHDLAGEQVKGYYEDDGSFVVDQENGDTYLYNEYVSTVDKVKNELYGIEANDKEWQAGLKLEPVYTLEVDMDAVVVTDGGTEVHITPGGSVVINTKKGKATSIQGIAAEWLDKTYILWDEYQENIKKLKTASSKARTEKPESYPNRFTVSDEQANWNVPLDNYSPVYYVAPVVIENDSSKNEKGWADPEDVAQLGNKVFESYEGEVRLDENGIPLNPHGRTGIEGRGLLGKWGANFAADPIVTRTGHAGEMLLLVIKRKDTGEWALPGGMVDKGERVTQALSRELGEEAGASLNFENAKIVYQGYVDDPRNTDNAWMETDAYHLHLTQAEADALALHAGDDAADVRWLEVTDENIATLYASHADIVRRAVAS